MAEAEQWLASFEERKKAKQVLTGGQQTLAQWLQTWLDSRPAHLKETTLNDYAYKLGHVTPLGGVVLADLTADMVDAWYAKLSKTTASTTARQARSLLTRALNEAVRRRYILFNAATAERTSQPPQKDVVRLSVGNTRARMVAVRNDEYELAFWIMVCCGLRAAEVCGLKMDKR